MYRETKTEGEAPAADVSVRAVDAVGQILINAAILQKQHGLCHDRWQSPDGSICPREAIKRASSDALACYAAEQRLQRYLGGRIDVWVIGRTLEEVISAMRSAAR